MRKAIWFLIVVLCLASRVRGQTEELFLPAGTLLRCTLDEPKLSSRTAEIGDPIICHVGFIRAFGRSAFPRGAYLAGRFDDYRDPGRFFGKGWIKLEFDRLILPSGPLPLSARVISAGNYRVDREGKIHGRGHAARDAVGWVIPLLWPVKVFTLPMRGPRPTLKGEAHLRLRLLDDVDSSTGDISWNPKPIDSKLRTEKPRRLDPIYSFNLVGTNIARSDTGAVVQIVGSGSFDPVEKTISGSGSFIQFNPDGSEAGRGSWEAANFLSFIAFGGPNPGHQGGILELTVALSPAGGPQQAGVPMSITCLVNQPRGFAGEEGITLGFFTNKVRGRTLFHVNL